MTDPVAPSEPILLLPLAPVVERLQQVCDFRQVGTAADIAAAVSRGAIIASPTAMVILLGAAPYSIEAVSGPLRQTIDVTIGVVIGVTLAGALGAAGLAELEIPVGQARGALFGWRHPDAVLKFWLSGESVDAFDETTGVLAYRLDFTTRVRIQENP